MKRIVCTVIAGAMCMGTAGLISGCGCSNTSGEPGYTVEATQPDLEGGDFGFYVINKNELMLTEYKGTATDIVIPETYNNYTVTTIGSFVFNDLDITSVTMPDTITEIQDYAFASCKNLKSVKLSDNLKTLGADVFFYCTSLESIELPSSLEDLGIYTFSASGLKSVTIPESEKLTELGGYVFYQCPNLTEVNIPSTVTKIDKNAFADCDLKITFKAPSGSYAEEYLNGEKANIKDFEFVAAE